MQTLAWLLCKLAQCKAALQAQLQGMDTPSQDTYALNFLAEFLEPVW